MKKRILSFVLSILILMMMLPISNIAGAEISSNTSVNVGNTHALADVESKIYYSDLFYAYPHLLLQDSFLQTYNADVNYVCNTIYENYNSSAAKFGTVMERTLEVVTSPADLTKQISDTLGLTDFDKNKAYDKANQKFIKHLLNTPASDSLQSAYGKTGDITKKTKSIVKMLELSAKVDENKSAEQYLLDISYSLWKDGILSHLSTDTIASILEELNASGTTLSGVFGLAATEIEIAQSFVIALMMEDIRMEIIDEMITSQTSDTILKEGMTRLKTQLSGGFVTYFISNYISDKLLNEVLDAVGDVVYTAVGAKLISDILSIAEKIVFDILLDEIPSYGEVLAYQVLINYSDCLYSAIQAKANSFIDEPLVSNEISKYESLFNAYVAANNAAFEIVAKFAPYEGVYEIFREAVENGIEVVTIDGEEYSSNLSIVEIDNILLEKLLSGQLVLIIDNGISKEKVYNKAETYFSIFADSLSESQQIRADFTDKYRGCDIFQLHIYSAKSQISGEPTVNWTYNIDENTTLRVQSDTIEPDSIYAYNNKLLGDTNVSGDINLTFPLEVMGDICWNNTLNVSFTICSGSMLKVNGNFSLNAGNPGYKNTSNSYFTLESDATLNIRNNFTIKGYKAFAKGTGYINTNLYGNVYVNGNLNIDDVTNTYIRGLLNVNGNLNQTSSYHYLDSTTCKVWVCDDANCFINGDFNIKGAYHGNVDVNWAVFEVSGGDFEVNGNLNATDRFVALRQTGSNSVWTIRGDAYVNALNKTFVPGFSNGLPAYACNFTAGKLIMYGDFIQEGGTAITPSGSHSIYLSGYTSQTISGINANKLIIYNTSGITFSNAIQVSTLFDHNGNPFTLYNNGINSVFVDYDKDGLNDNVDPYPTGYNISWSYDSGSGALTVSGVGAMPDFEPRTAPWIEAGYQNNIYSIVVEEGITEIGDWAFAYLYYVRSVTIPDSVTSIGTSAFYYNISLEEALIPDSVTYLGNGIFSYCKKLSSVSIPASVTAVPKYTLYGCDRLSTVYYSGDDTSWSALDKKEGNTGLASADVLVNTKAGTTWSFDEASGTLTIGGYGRMENYNAKSAPWYQYANGIKKIVVSEGVTGLGNWAFSYLVYAAEIELPESLVHIGSGAFYRCSSLKTIDIPQNITRIFSGAFYNCTSLESLTIPKGVTTVYANTFQGCSSLADVSYNGTEVQWAKMQILANNTELSSLDINYLVKSIEWSLSEDGTLTISGGVPMDDYELKVAPMAPWASVKTQIKKVVIEDGITNIGKNAFYGCTNLTEVVIPDSVTSIGYGAFWNCLALESIEIPEGVTYLGAAAFYNCASLKEITLPASVTSILVHTFYNCKKLATVNYGGDLASLKVAGTNNNYFISAIQ